MANARVGGWSINDCQTVGKYLAFQQDLPVNIRYILWVREEADDERVTEEDKILEKGPPETHDARVSLHQHAKDSLRACQRTVVNSTYPPGRSLKGKESLNSVLVTRIK